MLPFPQHGQVLPEEHGASGSGARDRVLLVEDEDAIAEPFARALDREGFAVRRVATLAQARAAVAEAPPEIVLLDLMLPDGDGRELARELQQAQRLPIIMITARGSELDRVLGLELGADDYIVKPFASSEVAARIRAVLRRTRSSAPAQSVALGRLSIDVGARRVRVGAQELALTRKEFDLLARLAEEPGLVVTREQLINDVWDENWFGSTKTLDVHIASLRRKLGDGAGASIETVRGVGFRLAAPGEG